MAGFKDIIPQFNPYVQQLPVEAMVKVGMEKQRRYDEGVRRIQSQIDQVAGMSVLRPVDKQYMQSKLNELGNNLKGVAAGDFSNFQLVNSVGGMIGQLSKDSEIMNAVSSTKRAQDELKKAQELYDKGKSSINNLNDIKEQIEEYSMSTEQGVQFTGKYVNYIDLNKKYQDIADNLKKNPQSRQQDNPFKVDALGNTLYYKKVTEKDASGKSVTKIQASTDPNSGGVPEYDDAMTRITVKGVSSQALYDAFSSSLTEDDIAQMRVDAKAAFKGKGPESIIATYSQAITSAKSALEDGIVKLKTELSNPKLSSSQKDEIEASINKYENKLKSGDFEKKLSELKESLKDPNNLRAAQLQAYMSNMLNSNAIKLANESYIQEKLSNPYQMAAHQRDVFQESIRQHNRNYEMQMRNYNLAVQKANDDRAQNTWERMYKEREFAKKYPSLVTTTGALSTDIKSPTVNTVDKIIEDVSKDMNTLNSEYSTKLGKSEAELNQEYQKFIVDPSTISNRDLIDYVKQRSSLESKLVFQNNIRKKAEEAALPFNQAQNKALEGVGGIIDRNGTEIFSAKDLFEVSTFINGSVSSKEGYTPSDAMAGPLVISPSLAYNLDEKKVLEAVGANPKQQAIAKALIKKWKGESMTPTERVIVERSSEISNSYGKKMSDITKSKIEAQANVILQNDPYYQQQIGTLNNENSYDMTMLDNLIGNTITKLNRNEPLSLPEGANLDADELAKMRAKGADGKMAVTSTIVKNYDGSATILLQQGKSVQTIPLSDGEFASYFPDYARRHRFADDISFINSNPKKTTNLSQKTSGDRNTDAVTARHYGMEIPLLAGTPYEKIVRWDIVGRDKNNGNAETDRFFLRVFVQKPSGSWVVAENNGGYQSIDAIQNYIETEFGVGVVQNILKNNK